MQHSRVEKRLFASRSFGEEDVAESHYGSPPYADLEQELQSRQAYEEAYMEATV